MDTKKVLLFLAGAGIVYLLLRNKAKAAPTSPTTPNGTGGTTIGGTTTGGTTGGATLKKIRIEDLPYFMMSKQSFIKNWWLNPSASLNTANTIISQLNQQEIDLLLAYYGDNNPAPNISAILSKFTPVQLTTPGGKLPEEFTGDDYDIIDMVNNVELFKTPYIPAGADTSQWDANEAQYLPEQPQQ